jgi:hypothetical protein
VIMVKFQRDFSLHHWHLQCKSDNPPSRHVSNVVKLYLCIVATSVPSERKFNYAGNFHTKARYNMSKFTLQDLMYIRMHMPRVEEFDKFMNDIALYCADVISSMNKTIVDTENSEITQ